MGTILITGGSGAIGTALTKALVGQGRSVRHLGRRPGTAQQGVVRYGWDPAQGIVDPRALEDVDHIVHLAGAGIADKRWTNARVGELIASRATSASVLLSACLRQGIKPQAFISAGGINYYGAITTEHVFVEDDPPGGDTIGMVSKAWEEAVDAWVPTARVVKLRTPVVLAHAGALPRLAVPVRWGLGAPLGTGRQWMPWVHMDDLVAVYVRALDDEAMVGAYNVNSGHDVTNATFMRTLAEVLRKPFFLPPLPGFVLRALLGELSAVLLHGARASNARLLGTGFRFEYAELRSALRDLL